MHMPCYKPVRAYKSRSRNENGKYTITFNATKALIEGSSFLLPCGGCIGCKIDRSRDWAMRCAHESQMHSENMFITLTYNDEHLPPDNGIHVRIWQLFMKQFRKSIAPIKVRFFASGEYTDPPFYRPHYHALIFGYQFPDLKFLTKLRGKPYYTSKSLEKLWPNGFHTISNVTYQTAAYVARYVMKKQNGDSDQAVAFYTRPHPINGKIFQVRREFCVQSRRPGIGSTWFDKFKSDAFPSDYLIVDGKKHSVPIYYTKKLAEEEARKIKRQRKIKSIPRKAENTRERLAVREQVKIAQLKSLKRDL